MIFRIAGGLYLTAIGLAVFGIFAVPTIILGGLALVAGIALLAGV